MQPVWLCLFMGRRFEDSFENTQWRKNKTLGQVIYGVVSKQTVQKNRTNKANMINHWSHAVNLRTHQLLKTPYHCRFWPRSRFIRSALLFFPSCWSFVFLLFILCFSPPAAFVDRPDGKLIWGEWATDRLLIAG